MPKSIKVHPLRKGECWASLSEPTHRSIVVGLASISTGCAWRAPNRHGPRRSIVVIVVVVVVIVEEEEVAVIIIIVVIAEEEVVVVVVLVVLVVLVVVVVVVVGVVEFIEKPKKLKS